MIEKLRKILNEGGTFEILLTELSKVFDCLLHELLIFMSSCLHVVDTPSLRLLHSCSTKEKQGVELNGTYSMLSEIIFGVPQGSECGPLVFKIFLCDLFRFFADLDIANYADDNTSHLTTATDKTFENSSFRREKCNFYFQGVFC